MFDINIKNFRSYTNQSFDFSRINILIGENSGGKSSLLKVLLSLKQTIENPTLSNYILSGNRVDLGSYKETVNNHDENKEIEFSFSFGEELEGYFSYFLYDEIEKFTETEQQAILSTIRNAISQVVSVTYILNKSLDIHSQIKTRFKSEFLGDLLIEFTEFDKDENEYESIIPGRNCNLIYISRLHNKTIVLERIGYEKKGFMSIVETSDLRKRCENYPEIKFLFYELALLLLNQNLLEYHLHNIEYLNPLLSKPERIYVNKDPQMQYMTSNLEKFASFITKNKISKKNLNKFEDVLKKYGIADGFKVVQPKELPVSELRIKIKELSSNISDVGYGVALQIPILFEAFIAENSFGRNFLIEQPEVHLHPKLQAKFIETLLSLGDKNSYIIETHSEYIVRMLQIIVKNNLFGITNNDIRIFYFSREKDEFKITKHDLDKNGKMIEMFPSGFYDNSYSLTKSLLL